MCLALKLTAKLNHTLRAGRGELRSQIVLGKGLLPHLTMFPLFPHLSHREGTDWWQWLQATSTGSGQASPYLEVDCVSHTMVPVTSAQLEKIWIFPGGHNTRSTSEALVHDSHLWWSDLPNSVLIKNTFCQVNAEVMMWWQSYNHSHILIILPFPFTTAVAQLWKGKKMSLQKSLLLHTAPQWSLSSCPPLNLPRGYHAQSLYTWYLNNIM